MADIELVIKIPEEIYKASQIIDVKYEDTIQIPLEVIANGVPLKKGHGRIVDIGKIDEDRIEKDNPVISLTVNGEYIEAVSLDYLNNLQTIIEADTESEEQFERSIITKTGMLDDSFWRTLELKHPLKDYQSESEDRGWQMAKY